MTFVITGKDKEEVKHRLDELMKSIEDRGRYDEHRSIIKCSNDTWKGIATPVFHHDEYQNQRRKTK